VTSTLLFPDNTVLVNFGILDEVDTLLSLLSRIQGAWCATVAQECSRSAGIDGLQDLAHVAEVLGVPLFPETQAEHQHVRMMQARLSSPGDTMHDHLGEAETIALVVHRGISAAFVTDDKAARRLAEAQGINCYSTFDLLKLCYRAGLLDADTLWVHLCTLRAESRGAPPSVTTRTAFDAWIGI